MFEMNTLHFQKDVGCIHTSGGTRAEDYSLLLLSRHKYNMRPTRATCWVQRYEKSAISPWDTNRLFSIVKENTRKYK